MAEPQSKLLDYVFKRGKLDTSEIMLNKCPCLQEAV